MRTLFNARTTNGTGTAIEWPGGTGTFHAFGTFGGASVNLQASFDNGTNWFDIPDTTLTQRGLMNVTLANTLLRANLTGAGGTTSVSAGI